MNANDITAEILIEASKRFPELICWRRNVGRAYPVSIVKHAMNKMKQGNNYDAYNILHHNRPVDYGRKGEPDIDGLVGPNGRRIGIEVKYGKDKQSEDQKVCQAVWEQHGAIYLIAKDTKQCLNDLERIIW